MAPVTRIGYARARALSQGLDHTYTRTPLLSTTTDPFGQAIETAGSPALLQPCLLVPAEAAAARGLGPVTADTPLLMVAADDPIQVGDVVSQIVSAPQAPNLATRVLLAGPLRVGAVTPRGSSDSPLYLLVRLTSQRSVPEGYAP